MAEPEVELVVEMPIRHANRRGPRLGFSFVGRLDALQPSSMNPHDPEARRVVDWKTCSDAQRFLKSKRIGFQAELYALAAAWSGLRIDEIEYRLIEVPSIRLCGKDEKDAVAQGTTPAQVYENRCLEWLEGDPGHLIESNLPINPGRLAQAQEYLCDCVARIKANRKRRSWLPNERACYGWNRECEMMPLCESVAAGGDPQGLIDEFFEVRDAVHPEIDESNGDFELTYSSCCSLASCEMYFYWHYERRLSQRNDFSESRELGSAAHVGLAGYLRNGLVGGFAAVDDWLASNPALGGAIDKAIELSAKARAIVRAVDSKWGTQE